MTTANALIFTILSGNLCHIIIIIIIIIICLFEKNVILTMLMDRNRVGTKNKQLCNFIRHLIQRKNHYDEVTFQNIPYT